MCRPFGNSPRPRLRQPKACIASRWVERLAAEEEAVVVDAARQQPRRSPTRVLPTHRWPRLAAVVADAVEADAADVVLRQSALVLPAVPLLPVEAEVVVVDAAVPRLCRPANIPCV